MNCIIWAWIVKSGVGILISWGRVGSKRVQWPLTSHKDWENFIPNLYGLKLFEFLSSLWKSFPIPGAIIGTYQERGAQTFWECIHRFPLKENPILCWKFCHVLHKVSSWYSWISYNTSLYILCSLELFYAFMRASYVFFWEFSCILCYSLSMIVTRWQDRIWLTR